MGSGRLCGGLFSDEALRGQPHSRRYSQTGIQNPAIQARGACSFDIRRDAFGASLAVSPELGLEPAAASFDRSPPLVFHAPHFNRDPESAGTAPMTFRAFQTPSRAAAIANKNLGVGLLPRSHGMLIGFRPTFGR